jgi:MFS family permease
MEGKEANSYKWLCLVIVIIGTFMAFLDTSIVNIAMPKIMSVFATSLDTAQWVLTGYMLTSAAVIPLTGYLEEILGFKKSLCICNIGFHGRFIFVWNILEYRCFNTGASYTSYRRRNDYASWYVYAL